MKLSLVGPCYNEEDNVAVFLEETMAAFDGCGYDYEIVFVNDGSRDNTLLELRRLFKAQKCPVKVVSFSRNFGKESAIYAGMEHAKGEYISIIDADLQQRPEIVRDMVSMLDRQPQYDVVAAYQDRRGEGKVLSFFKKCFYSIINKLSNVKLRSDASDFRTFRRCVAESMLSLDEYHRFSKGIFAWVGYETCFIPYTACERRSGTQNGPSENCSAMLWTALLATPPRRCIWQRCWAVWSVRSRCCIWWWCCWRKPSGASPFPATLPSLC